MSILLIQSDLDEVVDCLKGRNNVRGPIRNVIEACKLELVEQSCGHVDGMYTFIVS